MILEAKKSVREEASLGDRRADFLTISVIENRGSKQGGIMEGRPKIGIVRVPSNERGNFRSLDGIRSSYGHIRVGTYGPEPEVKVVVCDGKPPIEQTRKFKK